MCFCIFIHFPAFLHISKSKKIFSKKARKTSLNIEKNISKIEKNISKKARLTSLKAYRNISKKREKRLKTEKNISKKARNSQDTSYPFSSFTMMRAALSGAEV